MGHQTKSTRAKIGLTLLSTRPELVVSRSSWVRTSESSCPHLFAPEIKRHVEGVAVGIAGNASNVKGEYPLRYIPLKNIQVYCTVDDKDNLEETNRGQNQVPGVLLNGTPWESLSNLYSGYRPTVTALYHGQDMSYPNLLTAKARQTLKELGTGYHHWTLANIEARENQEHIQTVTDTMSLSHKVNHLPD